LVTGAASGIGRCIAEKLAIEQGAHVYVLDRDADGAASVVEGIHAIGGSAAACIADLANVQALRTALPALLSPFGAPEILVNNAAVAAMVPASDCALAHWELSIAVNLTAPMLLMQHVLPHMKSRGWGRIVNIASISAMRAGTGRMAYGTSKAGLIAMSRQFAVEVADRGITVNVVAPGPVDTPLARANHSAATRAMYGDRVPMRRYGTSEEIAAGVLFFSSEEASYVTGQTLAIDGGFVASGVLVPDLFKGTSEVDQSTAAQ
jgi:NAD(P)-dependent dehydrogenase (short-subunit alcohol dehydrogenase family)